VSVGGRMKIRNVRLLTVVFTAIASAVAFAADANLQLPEEFAGYRGWQSLLKTPRSVPWELAIRCVSITDAERATAMQRYGPHSERTIRVFGNIGGDIRTRWTNPLPVGSVIVKEKFAAGSKRPEGVAFMVKRGNDSRFRESGGWEFLYFPAGPDRRATHEACLACHRAAAANDYVFGKYPEQD